VSTPDEQVARRYPDFRQRPTDLERFLFLRALHDRIATQGRRQACGEIDPQAEVAQAAFEIQAMLLAGNYQFVMTNDPVWLSQARKGVGHVLAQLAVKKGPKKKRSARRSP
jgi:hypothetical protein